MKKNLRITLTSMTMILMVVMGLNAQEYLIYEGFEANEPPPGWTIDNVAWSSASSNAHNEFDGKWCAKLKPSECTLTTRLIQSADTLTFWMKVKDLTADAHLYILKSQDGGTTWDTIAVDPQDRLNDSVFQFIKVGIHDDPAEGIQVRWFATATGGNNSKGIFTVDDVTVSKMAPAADDATLSMLKVDDMVLKDFVYNKFDYELELPYATEIVTVSAEANNSTATVNITQPQNIYGTEASRTSTVEVTAPDGTTIETYNIVFSVSSYVFAEGFSKFGSNAVPFDHWEVYQTYTHDNVIDPGDHGEFPGIGAFKFVRGQEDKQGYLKFKYKGCGILSFYLFVQEPDGNEALKVEAKVGFGLPQTVGNYTADSMTTTEWKKFVIEINETDSVLFTFWPTMTMDGATRIWMDDISLTGFGFTPPAVGISNVNKQLTLRCYPNPATDLLTVDIGDNIRGIIVFHNVLGATIREIPVLNARSTIDVSQLDAGIYFISLKGNSSVFPTKLIVK